MKGIDVYQGDGWPLKSVPGKLYKDSDFVIVKATQGVNYNHTSYFYKMAKKVLDDGKLLGAYHYAAGHDPVKEADYFVAVVKGYVGKAILCLDWESIQNKAWGSSTWCTKFIKRVKDMTGITCFLYTGLDGIRQNKSLANKVPLWFAGYPKGGAYNSWTLPGFKYDLAPWNAYTIWQFTSSGEKCDRNTSKLTKAQWKSYASGQPIKKAYPGKMPVLPKRGYFKYGDGIYALRSHETQIKRVQQVVNWVMDFNLKVDGAYGDKTDKAVTRLQERFGLSPNGCFGAKCLKVCKGHKK